MNIFWQRFLAALTPGVRVLLGLLMLVYLVAVTGIVCHAFDLYAWLALSGSKFWSGQIWRLVTYALLPFGIMDFVMNGVALVVLGGMLERHWSRGDFLLYCVVAAAGAGIAKVILQSASPTPLVGAAPMMFGLLIGWGFLCGRENITIAIFGETTVWKLILVAAAVSLLIMLFTGGMAAAIIMAGGGGAGFFYLWLKHKWLMSRTGSVIHSERINRLEL